MTSKVTTLPLLLLLVVFFLLTAPGLAFLPIRTVPTTTTTSSTTTLQSTPNDPCWQDLYDEDCAMETLFTANYVAGEWIKELPCAKGMEDCDFPDEEWIPEIRPESNCDAIDVMSFLNIKRARVEGGGGASASP